MSGRRSASRDPVNSRVVAAGKIGPVRINLLGRFRIAVGDRTVQDNEWRLRKAASLIKMLALARGHRLHREQVMDRLWPDLDPKASSNNLHHALHHARRTLEPASRMKGSSHILLRQEHLVLCPEGPLWVDVETFEETAASARRARDPAAYRAAMDLYAGELLPEDRYEEWTEDLRQGLRATYLALLVELAGLHEERGEYGCAIEVLRRAVEEEPTGEEAHVGLMRLYTFSGRRAEALGQYERLTEVLARELAAEPTSASRLLYEEIKAGRTPTAQPSAVGYSLEETASANKHNLPAARSSFVGRQRELVEVKRELAMTRLLTLTGAGGSGKTRLALEVGRDLVGTYPNGVWLAELAGLSEGELVAQAVAAAMGVSERPDSSPTDAIVETVGNKKMLLMLDNCEHLIDAVACLADALLDACPGLRVLATSREALGVIGEVNWPVPTLSLPDPRLPVTVDELTRHESTRLFAERARCRNPAFALTPQNAEAVATVCRRLDGIPLGIELAAARIGALTVEQVAEKLADALGLLTSGSRTAAPRQRTLRGAVDWSYGLLKEQEQTLFRRLSVFAGGFTLEAAESVGARDGIDAGEVLDLLSRLVEKSLVVGVEAKETPRYRMLEPLRQYARARLEESGNSAELRRAHARHYLKMAEVAEPELTGPDQRLWVEELEREHDNLRAALSWTLEREEPELGLRLSGAFWRFWYARGYLSEGLRWLEQALTQGGSAPVKVKALEGLGWITQLRGDTERAKAVYGEMLELSRELGCNENKATALNSLGILAVAEGDNGRARVLLEENLAVLWELEDEGNATTTLKRFHVLGLLGILAINEEGDYARAVELWEEALALTLEVGDTVLVGQMLSNLGYAVLLQGDCERSATLSEEALTVARELGNAGVGIIPESLVNQGLAARSRGDHERARASFREALVASQEIGNKPSIINALEGMAGAAAALGDPARTARLWGAAEAAREVICVALPPCDRALHDPYLVDARFRLGEAAWEEALAEGQATTLERAVEYALSEDETFAAPSSGTEKPPAGTKPTTLTRREREIAALVARGLTNRQIASELVISARTVDNHVANILKKLNLRSREQIFVHVVEGYARESLQARQEVVRPRADDKVV